MFILEYLLLKITYIGYGTKSLNHRLIIMITAINYYLEQLLMEVLTLKA